MIIVNVQDGTQLGIGALQNINNTTDNGGSASAIISPINDIRIELRKNLSSTTQVLSNDYTSIVIMELPVYNIHQLIEPSAGITVIDDPDAGHLDIGDTRMQWSTTDITISGTTVINLPMLFNDSSFNVQVTAISAHIGVDVCATPLSPGSIEV